MERLIGHQLRLTPERMQHIARAGSISGGYVASVRDVKLIIFEAEVEPDLGTTFHQCEYPSCLFSDTSLRRPLLVQPASFTHSVWPLAGRSVSITILCTHR
jgi:hypothetical protein